MVEELFCQKCGKKLKKIFRFSHYHPRNGESLYIVTSTCPEKKWYNGHTKHTHGGYIDWGDTFMYKYYYKDGKEA